MARLLRLLPDSASPHEPRSVDPSKVAFVSLAAMANQAKSLRGVTPSRRSKVCCSSRSWFTNWALAHVGTSGGPTSPTQRQFRVARSSPNPCARPSLTRSNRRWYGPVCPVVWEGWRREASPYPDLAQTAAIARRHPDWKSPLGHRLGAPVLWVNQSRKRRAVTAGLCAMPHGAGGRAMSETRKIAAILVAEVVGYSLLAGADEDRILARLRALSAS